MKVRPSCKPHRGAAPPGITNRAAPTDSPIVVATSRQSRHSSPSPSSSAASSASPSHSSLFPESDPHPPVQAPYSPATVSASTSTQTLPPSGSGGVSRTVSTALDDDSTESPRPRKRPRLQVSALDSSMKFDNTTSTDLGENPDMHESNGNAVANTKNGILKEATNGVSSGFGNGTVRNGSHQSDRFFGHSRQEVTRLMIQALNDLGYSYVPL